MKINHLFLLAGLILISSCSKSFSDKQSESVNSKTTINQTITEGEIEAIRTETKKRLELITLITMDVLRSRPDLMNLCYASIQKNDQQNGMEGIYFKDIIANSSKLEQGFANDFVTEVRGRFESADFPLNERVAALITTLKSEIAARVANERISDPGSIINEVLLLPHLGSYIYFPYSDNFTAGSELRPFFCYDPQDDNAASIELFRNEGRGVSIQTSNGSDDWVERNPTIVIRLDDEIAGNHLDKYQISNCANNAFYKQLCPDEILGIDSVPPPPPPYCGLLTSNIAPWWYEPNLNDNYLLTATIPHVRLLKNLRWAFWSGSNRLALYKGHGKLIAPNYNDVGKAFKDSSIQVGRMEISRKRARKGWWVRLPSALTWNSDWRLIEFDNFQTLSVVKNWLNLNNAALDFNASVGAKWDTTRIVTPPDSIPRPRGWVSWFSFAASVSGKISFDRTREAFEAEQHITRRSFAINAIGDNLGLGTSASHSDPDGRPLFAEVPFMIRNIGSNFEYYFRVNICY